MNAREAYEKALWNKLPEKLRKEIEEAVKEGRYSIYYYESISPWIFKDSYYINLVELGYNIEISKIQYGEEDNLTDDNKLIISWNLYEIVENV
jgi:hypothetical protein